MFNVFILSSSTFPFLLSFFFFFFEYNRIYYAYLRALSNDNGLLFSPPFSPLSLSYMLATLSVCWTYYNNVAYAVNGSIRERNDICVSYALCNVENIHNNNDTITLRSPQ